MDGFVQHTGATAQGCDARSVMDYFDGNTVTAMWRYAQHFALSDNTFASTFGHDPALDDCPQAPTVQMTSRTIGDALTERGVTWGWFEGGFGNCAASHRNIGGKEVVDYIPHHEPFQYYASTANPHHLPPRSARTIGRTDRANHQCDLSDFWRATRAGVMPAVSFLKAPGYQDGHAGYSDRIDEQHFLVATINRIERLPTWPSTAILIAYDDYDGWYDHVMPPIVNRSNDPANDALL
jgi:phospholipase C